MEGSNDQVRKEEASELAAIAKHKYQAIKAWYQSDDEIVSYLRKDFGPFPLFSRELVSWPHFKPLLKAFNRHSNHAREEEKITTEKSIQLRKKKSRWGKKKVIEPVQNTEEDQKLIQNQSQPSNDDNEADNGKRKNRWTQMTSNKKSKALKKYNSSTTSTLATIQHRSFWLRLKVDEVNKRIESVGIDAKKRSKEIDRSVSPEPTYDSNGRRQNTREWRMRKRLEEERQNLMEELVLLNPSLRPKNMIMRHLKKIIYVPVDDYPGYNFLGLIIGPRGSTQRRLEKETKCKIILRGKGSVPESSRGRKIPECPDEKLHVLILAEEQEDLDKAVNIIEKLLTPGEDNLFLETHRQKQMQELALINGTTSMNEWNFCLNCGEKGHGTWECPNQSLSSYSTAKIKIECKICFEKSHITADCPMKLKKKGEENHVDKIQQKLDQDYNEFMEMVGERESSHKPNTSYPPPPPPLPM